MTVTRQEFDELKRQVELLISNKKPPRRLRQLNPRMTDLMNKLVLEVEDKSQPLFEHCDLFTSTDFVPVTFDLFPEHRDLVSIYDLTVSSRNIGLCLGASGKYTNMQASVYHKFIEGEDEPELVKVEKKYANVDYGDSPTKWVKRGRNVMRRIWVIRNRAKYEKMGPADLYREYERQQAVGRRAQWKAMEEQKAPSFL